MVCRLSSAHFFLSYLRSLNLILSIFIKVRLYKTLNLHLYEYWNELYENTKPWIFLKFAVFVHNKNITIIKIQDFVIHWIIIREFINLYLHFELCWALPDENTNTSNFKRTWSNSIIFVDDGLRKVVDHVNKNFNSRLF